MSSRIALHHLSRYSAAQIAALKTRTEADLSSYIDQVKPIIEAVRTKGDAALIEYAQTFDQADLRKKSFFAQKSEIDAAFDHLDPALISAMEYAADNIRHFHEKQKPPSHWQFQIRPGIDVGERYYPIDSVALYSPRGKGSFPSVTLMTAIPAMVAGVPHPLILTPPRATPTSSPSGHIDPATLVAARLAGVERIACIGGACAVAAAAFGTESIPRCRKIEGPGSPWFVAAKHVLSRQISSRLAAGPSEVIILADGTLDPRLVALDILIETEHGRDSSGFIVTWDASYAASIRDAIPSYLESMSPDRQSYAMAVLSGMNGGIVLADDKQQAYDFIHDYAPEHCQILSQTPDQHIDHIDTAAEILLGCYSAGSLANYMLGPNCVLPTSGAAHVHSPLGVRDFMRCASIAQVHAAGFAEAAPKTEIFARYEGFDAHAEAVTKKRLSLLKTP